MISKIKAKLKEMFCIDLRSLALLRICIAILIIKDLIDIFPEIKIFCSDEGILPRSLLFWKLLHPWHFSLFVMSGTTLVQQVLFIIAGLFAILFLVGYRTKFANFILLVFLASLQIRIEQLTDGGDTWVRLMLFWCMFLPVGACYSIDSALNSSTEKLPKHITSGGTILLLGQFVLIYWTTGLLKHHNIAWTSGKMVYFLFNYIEYATPLRETLLNLLSIEHFRMLTHSVMWFWIIGPILLFFPVFTMHIRIIGLIIFFAFQVGFYFCLDLGGFSFKSIAALIPFLPSQVWDKLFTYLRTNERLNLRIYYNEQDSFCKKLVFIIRNFFLISETKLISSKFIVNVENSIKESNSLIVVDHKGEYHTKLDAIKAICSASPILYPLPDLFNLRFISTLGKIMYDKISTSHLLRSKVETLFIYRPISPYPSKLSNVLAIVFLVYITLFELEILTNLDGINLKYKVKLPTNLKNVGSALHINQWWHMFVCHGQNENETDYARWHVIVGKLKDGTEIDLFRNNERVSWEKPSKLIKFYKNRFWAKYNFVARNDPSLYLPHFATYKCHEWNNKNKGKRQIEYIACYHNYQEILLNGKFGKINKNLVGQYNCPTNK